MSGLEIVLEYLPYTVRKVIEENMYDNIEEIRLRTSKPLSLKMGQEIKTGVTAITQTINDTISDKKIICRCGEENEQGSKFCSKCGSPLIKTCPNCHNEIETNDNYCNKCGTKLD